MCSGVGVNDILGDEREGPATGVTDRRTRDGLGAELGGRRAAVFVVRAGVLGWDKGGLGPDLNGEVARIFSMRCRFSEDCVSRF